ncbi:MAG: ACT domain-containing protein [Reinekea sp.]|jgi:glycine cleavage system regulatory protein
MKTQIVISIVGEDQEGFINKLTVKTSALGGKWLANKFAHLEGQIAGIIKLEIEQDKLDEFRQMLDSVEGLLVSYRDANDLQPGNDKIIRFTLEGEDRSSLTSDITHLLGEKGVKVEHYESRRYPVTELGRDVFEAHLDLRLPTMLSAESLKEALEQLSGRMRVFIA